MLSTIVPSLNILTRFAKGSFSFSPNTLKPMRAAPANKNFIIGDIPSLNGFRFDNVLPRLASIPGPFSSAGGGTSVSLLPIFSSLFSLFAFGSFNYSFVANVNGNRGGSGFLPSLYKSMILHIG